MVKQPIITDGLTLVSTQTNCIVATFYEAGNNPLVPISASDDRGMFYGLDYTEIRPSFVEIIHSRASVVRGNHIHQNCTEVLSVLSGTLDLYLLCNCPGKHLLKKPLRAGMSASVAPGIAHAIFTSSQNEAAVVFGDGDPRNDRERVVLIS